MNLVKFKWDELNHNQVQMPGGESLLSNVVRLILRHKKRGRGGWVSVKL